MRFIFLLTFLLFLTGPVLAGTMCPDMKDFDTEVRINLEDDEVFYDHSKTMAALTAERFEGNKEWLAENQMQTGWRIDDLKTGGVTQAGLSYVIEAQFQPKRFDRFGTRYCVFLKELKIDIFYRSKISIAKEIYHDRCKYPHIKEHEDEHHELNKEAIEQSVDGLYQDLPDIIEAVEGQGSVATQKVKDRAEQMKEGLQKVLGVYVESFAELSSQKNKELDTPEEYERVSRLLKRCDKNKR